MLECARYLRILFAKFLVADDFFHNAGNENREFVVVNSVFRIEHARARNGKLHGKFAGFLHALSAFFGNLLYGLRFAQFHSQSDVGHFVGDDAVENIVFGCVLVDFDEHCGRAAYLLRQFDYLRSCCHISS